MIMSKTNLHKFSKFVAKSILSTLCIVAIVQSASAKTLRIEVNKASVLKLTEQPSTIIIGNPALADVTPQENNVLVLVGKASGRTNIIILNDAGEIVHNYDIAVQEEQSGNLTMFKAGKQWTYSCAPYCERSINPNDDPEAFGANLGQVMAKVGQMSGAAANGASGGDIEYETATTPTEAAAGSQVASNGAGAEAVNSTLQTFTILPPSN